MAHSIEVPLPSCDGFQKTQCSPSHNNEDIAKSTGRELAMPGKRRPRDDEMLQEQESKKLCTREERRPPPWGQELHRDFVSAIFDTGVAHCSPSIIMANMQFHPQEATSERVKSHLQKFRQSRSKEKEKILKDYDKFLAKLEDSQDSSSPATVFDGMICLDGGQSAALLSHLVLKEEHVDAASSSSSSSSSAPFDILEHAFTHTIPNQSGYPSARLPFPELSEYEKSSPLGTSLMLTMGLLGHMEEYLTSKRRRASPPNKEDTAGSCDATDGEPTPMGSPHESSPPDESLLHSFQQVQNPQTGRLKEQSSTAQAFKPPPSHLPPHSLLVRTAQQGGERSLKEQAVATSQLDQLPAPLLAVKGGILNGGFMGILGSLDADQAFAATLQALGGGGWQYPLLPPPCTKLRMNGPSPPAPTSSATSSDPILHHRTSTSRSSTPLSFRSIGSFSDDGFGEFYPVNGNFDALA